MNKLKSGGMLRIAAIILALSFAWWAPCPADEKAAPDKIAFDISKGPITIKSEKLTASRNENMAEFSGGVKAVQGETSVEAEVLKIWYTSGSQSNDAAMPTSDSLDRIEAEKNVVIVSQGFTAASDSAEFDEKSGRLVLTGNPAVIESGANKISGAVITLDNEGKITWEGGVSAEITPEEQNENNSAGKQPGL